LPHAIVPEQVFSADFTAFHPLNAEELILQLMTSIGQSYSKQTSQALLLQICNLSLYLSSTNLVTQILTSSILTLYVFHINLGLRAFRFKTGKQTSGASAMYGDVSMRFWRGHTIEWTE
jgi:hypothetical protein